MSLVCKALAVLGATALLSSPAGAQLVTQKNIPLAMAQTIANAALAQCESMGFKVSVTVVDHAGLALVMLRGDGAGLHSRKATTARPIPRAPSAGPRRNSRSV